MSENSPTILTIKKLKVVERYVEFWFDELPYSEGCKCPRSCAKYKFDILPGAEELYEHTLNNGYKGVKMAWVFNNSRWEPFCFLPISGVVNDKSNI